MTQYNDKQFGGVSPKFSDLRSYNKHLVLGNNIRDLSRNKPGAVDTASSPSLQPAWQGTLPDDYISSMDIFAINIPNECRNSFFMSIELSYKSTPTSGDLNLCVHLIAVTVEYLR